MACLFGLYSKNGCQMFLNKLMSVDMRADGLSDWMWANKGLDMMAV